MAQTEQTYTAGQLVAAVNEARRQATLRCRADEESGMCRLRAKLMQSEEAFRRSDARVAELDGYLDSYKQSLSERNKEVATLRARVRQLEAALPAETPTMSERAEAAEKRFEAESAEHHATVNKWKQALNKLEAAEIHARELEVDLSQLWEAAGLRTGSNDVLIERIKEMADHWNRRIMCGTCKQSPCQCPARSVEQYENEWQKQARESAREAADANGRLAVVEAERERLRVEAEDATDRLRAVEKERDRLQATLDRARAAGWCDYSDTDDVAVMLRAEDEADRKRGEADTRRIDFLEGLRVRLGRSLVFEPNLSDNDPQTVRQAIDAAAGAEGGGVSHERVR